MIDPLAQTPAATAIDIEKAAKRFNEAYKEIRRLLTPYVAERYANHADDSNPWYSWSFNTIEGTKINITLYTNDDRGMRSSTAVTIDLTESQIFDEDYQTYLKLKERYES